MKHSTLSSVNRKPVLIWMSVMIGLVALMVIVGGVTRLTESGLSMVQWQPIHGILPPLNEAEWAEELNHYRQSPEYQQRNFGMSITEFKQIFWLEYLHRLLGRIVGLAFFLPLLYFTLKRRVSRTEILKYLSIFVLGGAQGLLGWYMVQSGLIHEPRVSPLRLSAHLTLACILFSLLLWQWWRLYQPRQGSGLYWPVSALIGLTFLQIILGAWVAGLDAGLAYDSFPTMNGKWIPNGLWVMEPWWLNPWQNPTTAQFIHRLGALVLTGWVMGCVMALYHRPLNPAARRSVYALIVLLVVQIALGALTIIHHVPITLAALHQFTAILLLGSAVSLLYSYPPIPATPYDDD